MGDPKKIRKKYDTPSHPWQKERIVEELQLKKEYGLKNKVELWMAASFLNDLKEQVKKINVQITPQANKEKEQLKNKLLSLGFIQLDQPINSILSLDVKDVLERRLQTIVYKKNLARSTKQARQFIVHRHISVCGTKITSPSYIVTLSEENQITFDETSALANPTHPERFEELKKEVKDKKEKKKKDDEEEVVAFEEVPEDEEAIVKEALVKKKEEEAKKEESSKESGETKK